MGIEDNIREGSDSKYRPSIEKFGLTSKGLDWKDQSAQQHRYVQLAKLFVGDQPFSVNDLGCGFGDFSEFLQLNFSTAVVYYGYDIVPYMIDLAREKFPGGIFDAILKPEEMKHADYTVSCGIFNAKFALSDEEWWGYITSTVNEMFRKSLKGIAFNALTSYSDQDYKRPDLYYTDPCRLFDFCKKNLSRNVALLHDYDFYDFTMIVRK